MEKLKQLREERGLSQVKLAARADLNPATVNQIERGMRDASPGTLRKLADALDISLYDLLEEKSPKALAPPFQPEAGEERRALLSLLSLWTYAVNSLRGRLQDLLNNLPARPDADQVLEGKVHIEQLIDEFYSMHKALGKYGAGELLQPYAASMIAGEQTPDDIRRGVREILDTQSDITLNLIPRGIRWVQRKDETNRLGTELAQTVAQWGEELKESKLIK